MSLTSLWRQCGGDGVPSAFKQDIWAHVNDVAEQFNDPGNLLHLLVTNGHPWSMAKTAIETSSFVMARNAFLHAFLINRQQGSRSMVNFEDWVDDTGGQVMSIPHNSNLSDGQDLVKLRQRTSNRPLYAQRRNRWNNN